MVRPESVQRALPAAAREGVAVLVAADASPPGHECVPGELVWTCELCDDLPCQCEWGFNGVASGGITRAAEVRRLAGITRRTVRAAVVERMVAAGYPADVARARVDAILDLAAALPDGTLLRLEHGRPVPFPPGSRVVAPRRIVSPWRRE